MRLAVARPLAAVRLHRWEAVSDLSGDWLRKRRTAVTEMLIPPGNLYLRMQGAPVEVLACHEWIAWESRISQLLGRSVRPTWDHKGLDLPVISGVTLDQLLRADRPVHEKRRGIFLATIALRKLHQFTVIQTRGEEWPLSHGDATSRNVIVDLPTDRAHWIDFDTRHRQHLSASTRQADDLRALIWSSAACVDPSTYLAIVNEVWHTCHDDPAWDELVRSLSGLIRPTVFQLAQAPLSSSDGALLHDAIATVSRHSRTDPVVS